MESTKGELKFIGCAMTGDWMLEKVKSASMRGYGVLIEPVADAFNLYQITIAKAKSAPDLYEALKDLACVCRDVSYTHSELNKARQALAKAEGK